MERAAAADARGSTVRKSHTIPSVRILIPWRDGVDALASAQHEPALKNHSATGTRTRVARVRAEYPNQLDYSGCCIDFDHGPLQQLFRAKHLPVLSKHVRAPLLTVRPTPTPTRCHWLCCHAVFNKDTDGSPVSCNRFLTRCVFPDVPHLVSTRISCFLKSRLQLLGLVGFTYGRNA